MSVIAALFAGILFGAGLVVSGMTEPANVIRFLNLAPGWSPALMLVMGSALVTAGIGYRLAGRRHRPLFDEDFHAPVSTVIDQRLIIGAILFGIGWGVAGFCPGPAIVGAFALDERALIFIAAYLAGTVGFERWDRQVKARAATADG
jgi:uncharacterized membrane protein YedE/YeeE